MRSEESSVHSEGERGRGEGEEERAWCSGMWLVKKKCWCTEYVGGAGGDSQGWVRGAKEANAAAKLLEPSKHTCEHMYRRRGSSPPLLCDPGWVV